MRLLHRLGLVFLSGLLASGCASVATDPNYKPGSTLYCYDCHDDAALADVDPDPANWLSVTHKPQTGGIELRTL